MVIETYTCRPASHQTVSQVFGAALQHNCTEDLPPLQTSSGF